MTAGRWSFYIFNGYAFFHAFKNITDHILIRIDINAGDRGVLHIFHNAVEIGDDHIQLVLFCQFPVFYREGSFPFIQVHGGREVYPLLFKFTDPLGKLIV